MREITLKTGKKIQLKELTAYQEFSMSKFLTTEMMGENGGISAAFLVQSSMLRAVFSIDQVDGEKVNTPTDQKSFIKAMNMLTGAELQELTNTSNEEAAKANEPEGNDSSGATGETNGG